MERPCFERIVLVKEDFVLTCYAAVYGIGLGIFMLIFIFLGSQVRVANEGWCMG